VSRRRNNLHYKTAAFIGLSTVLHAGFLMYVAASNYGSDIPGELAPSTGESVMVEFTPEIKTEDTTPIALTPAPAPELPAPKITTEPKNTKLPEKSPAIIAKSKEKIENPVVSESPESVPVPVAAATKEKKAEQQLVEQIQNDVVTPAPEIIPATIPDTQTEATAVVPDPTPAEVAVPAILEKSAPTAPVAASAPAGNTNVVSESAPIMPVRQDSELRAMPGNKDPSYNFDDRLAKREGEIKFLAEVTPEGSVTNVRMLKSTGHKSLDMAALKSFKNYRYQPGQQGYVLKSFNFVLKGPARQLPSRLADRTSNNSIAK